MRARCGQTSSGRRRKSRKSREFPRRESSEAERRDQRANGLVSRRPQYSALKTKASKKHSKEYKKARERHPTPEY